MKCFNWNDRIDDKELEEVSKVLNGGGVVIFPTETVYGIAASALNEKAIDKLYKAKRRPREKAINIMVSDRNEIEKYAYVKSETAKEHKGLSAGSFKDLTRVAYLNETMWTELFLENKKHVLCEIPLVLEAGQAKELYDLAENNNLGSSRLTKLSPYFL